MQEFQGFEESLHPNDHDIPPRTEAEARRLFFFAPTTKKGTKKKKAKKKVTTVPWTAPTCNKLKVKNSAGQWVNALPPDEFTRCHNEEAVGLGCCCPVITNDGAWEETNLKVNPNPHWPNARYYPYPLTLDLCYGLPDDDLDYGFKFSVIAECELKSSPFYKSCTNGCPDPRCPCCMGVVMMSAQTSIMYNLKNPRGGFEAIVQGVVRRTLAPKGGKCTSSAMFCADFFYRAYFRFLLAQLPTVPIKVRGSNGVDYRGTLSVTLDGRECQNWAGAVRCDSVSRCWQDTEWYENYQGGQRVGALNGVGSHNYCRNAYNSNSDRPWCWTTTGEVNNPTHHLATSLSKVSKGPGGINAANWGWCFRPPAVSAPGGWDDYQRVWLRGGVYYYPPSAYRRKHTRTGRACRSNSLCGNSKALQRKGSRTGPWCWLATPYAGRIYGTVTWEYCFDHEPFTPKFFEVEVGGEAGVRVQINLSTKKLHKRRGISSFEIRTLPGSKVEARGGIVGQSGSPLAHYERKAGGARVLAESVREFRPRLVVRGFATGPSVAQVLPKEGVVVGEVLQLASRMVLV